MRIFFLLLFLLLFNGVHSQSISRIQGNVISDKKKPLSFVTISLLKANDSSLVKSLITSEAGQFDFTVSNSGKYILKLTLVGFETQYSTLIEIESAKDLKLDTIILKEFVHTLTNHVITTKKPYMELKSDKIILNVESSINSSGISAFELLRKSPGVQVDNNDNISMKGKSGVRIAIDGKMTQLDAKDVAAYLKTINSSEIEVVELITNPSAKYEASGSAGIINIRLKKSKKLGTNGSINLNFIQGLTPKGSGNFNFNHRNKKFNLFGNIGFNTGVNKNSMNLYRIQKDTLYDFKNINYQKESNLNIKAGVDYAVNSRSTIGILYLSGNSNSDELGFSNTPIYLNSNHQFIKNLQSNGDRSVVFNNSNLNLNYNYTDSFGRELNVDANYGTYRKKGNNYQPNNYLDEHDNLLYSIINRNETPVNIDIYNLKVDYERKINKGKLGLGLKLNQVNTNNTFNFYTENSNGISVKDLGRSNLFNYQEDVNAGYISFNKELNKKWGCQIGLRVEHTQSDGVLTRLDTILQVDNKVNKSYWDLFPSLAFNWQLNEKNTFNISYSRRIDRPTYQDLNPFENKLDELTYQKGNAFLKPQYSHSIQFNHSYKSILNSSIGYTKVSDYSTDVTDTIRNATYIQQQNIAYQQIINFELGIQTPVNKWWNGNVNLWYNYKLFEGFIGNNSFEQKIPAYGANVQQSLNVGKEFTVEINGWYEGPSVWGGTWKTSSQGAVDLGVQKMLLNKALNIKMGVTDLLYTAPWKAYNNFAGVNIRGNGSWESRVFRLSLSWRIGSNQIIANRKRETGIESETKRIK